MQGLLPGKDNQNESIAYIVNKLKKTTTSLNCETRTSLNMIVEILTKFKWQKTLHHIRERCYGAYFSQDLMQNIVCRIIPRCHSGEWHCLDERCLAEWLKLRVPAGSSSQLWLFFWPVFNSRVSSAGTSGWSRQRAEQRQCWLSGMWTCNSPQGFKTSFEHFLDYSLSRSQVFVKIAKGFSKTYSKLYSNTSQVWWLELQ